MTKKILPLIILTATMLLMASCLKDDDDTSYTTYDDAALTTFSLTAANQYHHTTGSAGNDSVYMTTVTTSQYTFYIDQTQGMVWNPDSLPYGTDAKHLLATITAKNGGHILLKSMTSDSLTYYSSTDSIDFSQPRTLRIYSNDGSDYRDYMVKVNVHQEYGDTLLWTEVANLPEVREAQHMKLFSISNTLYLLTSDGTATQLWSGGTDGKAWAVSNTTQDANAWKNAVVKGDALYVLTSNSLRRMTADGKWSSKSARTLWQLVGASTTELYATNRSGELVASSDEGTTWRTETIDEATALLPTDNITCTTHVVKTNNEIERVTITGTTSGSDHAVSWTKYVDHNDPYRHNQWMYVDQAGDYQYALPKLNPLVTFAYDDKDVALGVYASAGTFSDFLVSSDAGVTWMKNSEYVLPQSLTTTNGLFAATVDNRNFIWILSGNGKLWRGRITRLGWEKAED